MNKNQTNNIINMSVSLGLKLLGGSGARAIREHFNASLAENPTYCMRLQYMALISSEEFSTWLKSSGKIQLFNRIQEYITELNQNPQEANYNLATDLTKIANDTNDNAARILAAASMPLFFDDEGVIGASEAVARVDLNSLFEDSFFTVLDLCNAASSRFFIFLFFALWKTNYDGVYEALCELLPKEDTLREDEKAALQTAKRATIRDQNAWLKIAINFYNDLGFSSWTEYNPVAFVLRLLLEYRESAASVITKRHPDFAAMEDEIKNTNNYLLNSSSFNDEYYSELKKNLEAMGDLNKSSQSLHDDIYFSTFMAAHGSFLFQGDADFWQQHVEKLFSTDVEVRGLAYMAMIVVLLWSSNYNGFQDLLQQAVLNLNDTDIPTHLSAESADPESLTDSNSQASFPDIDSLKIEKKAPSESDRSETNTHAPVQARRRRRSEKYDNETQPNIDTVQVVEQIKTQEPAQQPIQVAQSNIIPNTMPETVHTGNDSSSVTIANSSFEHVSNTLAKIKTNKELKQFLKSIPGYFKDKKSLGIIVGTSILFAIIFGFSIFKLLLGGALGIGVIYYLRKHNILLKSPENFNSNPSLQATTGDTSSQESIKYNTSQSENNRINGKAQPSVSQVRPSRSYNSSNANSNNSQKEENNSTIIQGSLIPLQELTREDVESGKEGMFAQYSYSAWEEMMNESDAAWCTQTADSLNRMIPYGRMRFLEFINEINPEASEVITRIYNNVVYTAKKVAFSNTAPCDMIVSYPELENNSYKTITVKFDAWRLAHFESKYIWRKSGFDYTIIRNWDYCLGKDGNIYHVTTSYTIWHTANAVNKSGYSCHVRSLIPFDNIPLFANKNQNLFIAISHGLLFALDYISIGTEKEYYFDAEHTYNFPLEINSANPVYDMGEGMLSRLNLLTKQESSNHKNSNARIIDMNLYALIGAKLYGIYDGDIDLQFTSLMLQYKLPLAEEIVKEHPEFAPINDFLHANYSENNISADFDKLFDLSDLIGSNTKYTILLAALGTFLDRNNPDKKTSENCILCLEKALNTDSKEVVGLPSITLLCVALWFSNYKNYKELVYENIVKLSEEKWYEHENHVHLNEVRHSIDISTNKV